jgi:hypothetical protein
MSSESFDAALIAVLGGNTNPAGTQPLGLADRLNALPDHLGSKVRQYLELTMQIPLPAGSESLAVLAESIAKQLSITTPELSDLTRQKLANYYAFEWR